MGFQLTWTSSAWESLYRRTGTTCW